MNQQYLNTPIFLPRFMFFHFNHPHCLTLYILFLNATNLVLCVCPLATCRLQLQAIKGNATV
jgi:hypothetical protein